MNRFSALLVGAALVGLSSGAVAQEHQHHPAPTKPVAKDQPATKKPVSQKKPVAKKKPAAKKPAQDHGRRSAPASSEPATKQPTAEAPAQGHEHHLAPATPEPVASAPQPSHATHQPAPGATGGSGHAGHAMTGALGSYPMTRESSGTAWQPDTSAHMGPMWQSGDWTFMAHGTLNLVYSHQSGRRGDDKIFGSGMLMGMARRPIGDGALQFRASISPDPLMGKRGYPLLLAAGETANGVDRLVDRQHPHEFVMELSASVSQNLGPKSSLFLYAGLPGEPAFGPPAFMHREGIMDSPAAPISHHWLDSTHITFGLLTAGIVHDRFKVEVSRFNGREPDQHRWDIETGPLDSTSVRVSWNPVRTLSLQGSWGHFEDPEQLEPGVDQRRWSASALWADEIAPGWKAAGTLAWGRKSVKDHHGERLTDNAYVFEASLKNGPWTAFTRGEITENRELLESDDGEHGPAFTVGKVSLGAIRDFKVAKNLAVGMGGLVSVNFIPAGLRHEYGGSNPLGAMGFLRLKVE